MPRANSLVKELISLAKRISTLHSFTPDFIRDVKKIYPSARVTKLPRYGEAIQILADEIEGMKGIEVYYIVEDDLELLHKDGNNLLPWGKFKSVPACLDALRIFKRFNYWDETMGHGFAPRD